LENYVARESKIVIYLHKTKLNTKNSAEQREEGKVNKPKNIAAGKDKIDQYQIPVHPTSMDPS
jgi:hypothetical protein